MLKIALQKSGRLSESSLSIFKECGIKISNGTRKLKATARNFPVEFLFLRDDDIPGYVEDGVAHVGIIGENVLRESGKDIEAVKALGFSRCKLCLAVSRGTNYTDVSYWQGKSIATSYPVILKSYLEENGVSAHIHTISGSVEIAPGIGLTDGICDLVSTGSTLLSNGLKEVETVMESEAVLVKNKQLSQKEEKILDQILFRLEAVLEGQKSKYVLMNAPNASIPELIKVLPGMRSPTVLPLAEEGWSSIHTVIGEDDFWERIDQLKENGAEGILVAPIEKMIK